MPKASIGKNIDIWRLVIGQILWNLVPAPIFGYSVFGSKLSHFLSNFKNKHILILRTPVATSGAPICLVLTLFDKFGFFFDQDWAWPPWELGTPSKVQSQVPPFWSTTISKSGFTKDPGWSPLNWIWVIRVINNLQKRLSPAMSRGNHGCLSVYYFEMPNK